MTPAEKAKNILSRMSKPENIYQGTELAKQNALELVSEVISESYKYSEHYEEYVMANVSYWKEVREELNKL